MHLCRTRATRYIPLRCIYDRVWCASSLSSGSDAGRACRAPMQPAAFPWLFRCCCCCAASLRLSRRFSYWYIHTRVSRAPVTESRAVWAESSESRAAGDLFAACSFRDDALLSSVRIPKVSPFCLWQVWCSICWYYFFFLLMWVIFVILNRCV